MNSMHLSSDLGEHAVMITRVAERQWHALEHDRVSHMTSPAAESFFATERNSRQGDRHAAGLT